MKRKNQRLALLLSALAAVLGAALLFIWGIRDTAAYFYTPGDVARRGLEIGHRARIGGMVLDHSLRRLADGVTIEFVVGDETSSTIRVRYRGIVPDLFKERSGVVAEGAFEPGGVFAATEILAKHDENYRPPVLDPRTGEHKSKSLR